MTILTVPENAIASHVQQEEDFWNYDGPWDDRPSRWNYWQENGEWVGITTHKRYGAGYKYFFGKFHPLTGERVDE
ncbi:MAG: hypothetical protein HC890_07790 [Chloroflexaceae bacterium]|nr:hypothetical protein [Chloroflexaceae bacterium]